MATSATDAQRLIALSLGKIAASRSQRGGALLHKSLLVSTVLHKARTAFMMENFQAMLLARRQQSEAEEQSNKQTQSCEFAASSPPDNITATPEQGQQAAGKATNMENPSPSKHGVTCERTCSEQENKENAPPPCEIPMDITNRKDSTQTGNTGKSDSKDKLVEKDIKSCAKCCLKRRLSQELDADTVNSLPSKRNRSDSLSETSDNSKPTSSTQTVEPMQTECVQISNLVKEFSSGFGFNLGGNATNNNSIAHGDGNLPSSGHSENLISCSTQVKDCHNIIQNSFQDNLQRPVIALTV